MSEISEISIALIYTRYTKKWMNEWMNLLLMMNILPYIQHDGREKHKKRKTREKIHTCTTNLTQKHEQYGAASLSKYQAVKSALKTCEWMEDAEERWYFVEIQLFMKKIVN